MGCRDSREEGDCFVKLYSSSIFTLNKKIHFCLLD